MLLTLGVALALVAQGVPARAAAPPAVSPLTASLLTAPPPDASQPAGSPAAVSAPDAPAGAPAAGVPCAAGRTRQDVPLLKCQIQFEGRDFTYYVYLPPIYDGKHPLPAILLLHGAGGNGLDSISAWHRLGEANGVVLIAPTLPSGPALEPKVHLLLHAVLEASLRERKIDPRRIYLFGHSMGGAFTFDAAMLDAGTYAAAAVHASAFDPGYDWMIQRASRKVPIALYIGDHDQYFSLDSTRRTRDILQAAGFTVHYVEMTGHDHNYAAVAGEVNQDAWKFLSQYSLPK